MKFREFKTSSGKKVLAGKDAESNEQLIAQAENSEIVLHTAEPGSPFVNIKKQKSKRTTKQDTYEAAVFCSIYSQAWKKAKRKPKQVAVHVFRKEDIFKDKKMKTGTFGVKKHKKISVKKEDILNFEKKIKNE